MWYVCTQGDFQSNSGKEAQKHELTSGHKVYEEED